MRVLVLDRTHAVLVDAQGALPEVAAAGDRALPPVGAHFARLGLTLPPPVGSRPAADGGRDLVFVLDRVPAPPGLAWRPLREVSGDDDLWSLYVTCALGGWEPPSRALDVWSFGDGPEMAARLLHLVAAGDKRATACWVDAARQDGTPLPAPGGTSVVTDGFGHPRVVLRTVAVEHRRFADVDAALAAAEGEGDLSLADWREGHHAFFAGEAAKLGLSFTDDALIGLERFEVLHVVGAGAPGR